MGNLLSNNSIVKKYQGMSVQLKASLWFLLCSFLQKGVSVITTPIFTRLLTTSEYGQYNVFNSWYNILIIFVTLSLSAGVYTQGLVKFDDEQDIFSSSLQGLTLALVLIWTGIYWAFHNFWNNMFSLTTVQMLAMLVMMWTTSVFGLWSSEQRVKYKYKLLVCVTLAVSIMKPAFGIFLVTHAEDKVTARILGLVLVEFVGYSAFFFIQMFKGKTFFSKKYWTYALGFNLPLVPHYLSQTILNSADRIMIERMIGDSEAGIYSLAYSISLIMTLFNAALMSTMNPWIYQKIKARSEKDIASVAYGALLVIATVNIILIAFAPEAVRIFAPSEYYEAIYVIPPIAMSVYFMFAYDLFAKFEFYFEKTKWIATATMGSAVLNIVLNYVFIKLFGYMAAGYTTLVCYVLYVVFHYLFMTKICKDYMDGVKVYDIKILLALTLVFMVVGFSFLFLYDLIVVRYIVILSMLVAIILFRQQIIGLINKIVNLKSAN